MLKWWLIYTRMGPFRPPVLAKSDTFFGRQPPNSYKFVKFVPDGPRVLILITSTIARAQWKYINEICQDL